MDSKNRVVDRGHVLVIEDDTMLQGMLRKVFLRAGYRVSLASNATEALELLASSERGFCAAYLDLTLPGISGAELLSLLRVQHPSLPVVLTSGRDAWSIPAQVRAAATELLPKPYDLPELLSTFARVARAPTRAD